MLLYCSFFLHSYITYSLKTFPVKTFSDIAALVFYFMNSW
jgi:hypothetical protein